ncbi:phosphoribosylanthranilate isomerase [Tenacibaculum skagerrakense]|uniref:N-(5'-phosphoribosyl)anthranilate isomerase n=1 Tax=Tenacibaculum skagerrakense TaxID=186571 RepID=A0A4R2P1M9_9FLAO|nr:phosphoribosylanthranilate isomerase [Tenacibaculum skagerrakense]TCP28603.1 phosphoribosylanthranilate isomerase [Tenacibaculum skagerrakense]
MKLKVCGMKYVDNIRQVAELKPDYLGFIFYERSKRNFEGIIPEIPKGIKKTGVFVNEYLEILVSLAEEYKLEAIQLHGDESVAYIKELKSHLERSREEKRLPKVEIIKVFGIKDTFDFSILEAYESVVDYFLFDTKGKERGGNGVVFDWTVLKNYPSTKPFFLSGGIGLEEVPDVLSFLRRQESQYCVALDVNSKFETKPGLKSIKELKKFKNEI